MTRQPINEAVHVTAKQQMLLNIVRLKYQEPPEFLAVPSITESMTYKGDGAASFDPFGIDSWGIGAEVSERPTLSYAPLQDAEFNRRLVSPMPQDVLDLLAQTGWSPGHVMRLLVKNINDVDNASSAGGPAPEFAPEFMEFKIAMQMLDELQKLRQAEVTHVSDEVVQVQKQLWEGEGIAMTPASVSSSLPSKPDEKEDNDLPDKIALRFSSEAVDSQELSTFQSVFRLSTPPETPIGSSEAMSSNALYSFYKIRRADWGQLWRRQVIQTDLWITPRSFLEILYFLSHGVSVPDNHVRRGLVRVTRNHDGSPFDWCEVTGDLLQVYVSKHRPLCASTSVRFKGHWYYVREDDLRSKSTFAMLMQIYNMAVRSGAVGQVPQLTIPVS